MKPTVKLVGENGNVFNLASIVSNELKKEGLKKEAEEFKQQLFKCKSYDEALRLMMNYVEIE